MEEGTLSFCVEGQFLGVAHRGLRGKKGIHEKYGNDDNGNDDNYNDDDDNDDGRQTRTILHQGSMKVKALGFVVPFAIFLLQVYPIVSAVWGHCEITMKYLGEFSAAMFRPFKLVCCTCKTRILFPKNLSFLLKKIFCSS